MFLAFKSKIIRKSEILIINLQKFELTIEILTKDLDKINITYSSTEEYSKDIKRVIEECSFKKDIDLFEVIQNEYINLVNISSLQIFDNDLKGQPITIIHVLWKGNKNLPRSFVREDVFDATEKENFIKNIKERVIKYED